MHIMLAMHHKQTAPTITQQASALHQFIAKNIYTLSACMRSNKKTIAVNAHIAEPP
jgi:hypothetical protein